MIVRMKKVHICIRDKDRDAALKTLRNLGLMHIMTPKKESEQTALLLEKIHRYDRVRTILENAAPHHGSDESVPVYQSLEELTDRIIELDDEISDLHDRLRALGAMERFFEQWGDFNPKDVQNLSDSGLFISFAKVKEDSLLHDLHYITLKKEKTHRRIMVVQRDRKQDLPFEHTALPELGLRDIKEERKLIDQKISIIHHHFHTAADAAELLKKSVLEMTADLEFEEVKNGLEEAGSIRWFTGFIPEDETPRITEAARKHAWALIINDPSPEEPVPTKMKNRPFVRLIEPIFSVLGTVPGYREYDISGLFLIFFAVFVPMIIGDAGYGVLFLAGAVLLHRRAGKVTRLAGLIYLLSGTTILWGALTGTWFGSETIASWGVFQALMVPGLASFPSVAGVETYITQRNVMYLCFIIGTVQLSIACLMNFKRDFPMLSSYSHIGWLVMIIGLYFLVLNLVLGFDLPVWSVAAVAVGFVLIILFNAQQEDTSFLKGLLRGVGGLFTTFLDSISTFSNIISYIRLFAVGMASVAISSSFNSMAQPLFSGVLIPAALLVLLIGHGLNIVMALLSVFVHGIRLNMLEFSGQLGMEWTGFSYAPFREQDISDNT